MLKQKLNKNEEVILLKYLEKLENSFKIESVILFGSLTKGRSNYKSDIDLLIVTDDMGDDWFQRHQNAYSISKGKVQPFVITTEEFIKSLKNRQTIVWEALADGIILYDRGVAKRISEQFQQLINSRALERMNKGWHILKPELIGNFEFEV